MEKRLFNTIEEVLDAGDFYVIYEENGEKRIAFTGYVYTNGDPGYRNGELDETLCYRIVEYSDGMDFSLEEYLAMSQEDYDHAYDVRGNDYIGDATEEEAFETANNWFGKDVKINRATEKITMNTPVGYYV